MLYTNHAINSEYLNLTNKELQTLWSETIGKPVHDRYLLSQSVKIIKGEKLGYLTGVVYLTPAVQISEDLNICSDHEIAGCKGPCLAMSGQMASQTAVTARKDRLDLFTKNCPLFFVILYREIEKLQIRARERKMRSVVRLNGTGDLDWTRIKFNGKTIFQYFPLVRFYDYTKNFDLVDNYRKHGICVTFSWYKKAPIEKVAELLKNGTNVAIAYRDRVPSTQVIGDRTVRVINGDEHDLRFLDDAGVIVGLKYKNQTFHKNAKKINKNAHKTGFIAFSTTAIQ